MRILLFEYFTGGWCQEVPPDHLYREGKAMLGALAEDLSSLPGVEVSVLYDSRLPVPEFDAELIAVNPQKSSKAAYRHYFTGVLQEQFVANDAFWPIAPETDGILANLCELAERSECALLNASADAVRIASDKLKTIEMLRKAGVPCIETLPFDASHALPYPVVVKPNDGVGCEGQRIVHSEAEMRHEISWEISREISREISAGRNYVVQPYLEGVSGSLSVICCGDGVEVLAVNKQNIEQQNNTFVLSSCEIAEFKGWDWPQIAESVERAIPGLLAYVGIDFILSANEVLILEVNPRLTTSYVGLAQALGRNPVRSVIEWFERHNGAAV